MRTLLLVLAATALLAAPAFAQDALLPDIEDEVMCVVCGTALNVSNSASAEQQRDFIRNRIAEGMGKQEIKDALVAEYGPAVLAMPEDEGFDLVPVAIALLALAAIGLGVRRWRAKAGGGADDAGPAGPDLDPDDARRLDAELAAFDR